MPSTFQNAWLDLAIALVAMIIGWTFGHLAKKISWLQRFGLAIGLAAFVGVLVGAYTTNVGGLLGERADRIATSSSPKPPTVENTAVERTRPQAPSADATSTSPKPPTVVSTAVERTRPQAPPADATSTTPYPAVRRREYLSSAVVQSGQPILLVVDSANHKQLLLTSVLANEFAGNGGAFLPAFLEDGSFGRAHDGDPASLSAVDGIGRVPLIMLVTAESDVAANNIQDGLRQAHLTLNVRLYRPPDGFQTSLLQVRADGAGFSDADALTNAGERAARDLRQRIR